MLNGINGVAVSRRAAMAAAACQSMMTTTTTAVIAMCLVDCDDNYSRKNEIVKNTTGSRNCYVVERVASSPM
jgi:hypothetical protein